MDSRKLQRYLMRRARKGALRNMIDYGHIDMAALFILSPDEHPPYLDLLPIKFKHDNPSRIPSPGTFWMAFFRGNQEQAEAQIDTLKTHCPFFVLVHEAWAAPETWHAAPSECPDRIEALFVMLIENGKPTDGSVSVFHRTPKGLVFDRWMNSNPQTRIHPVKGGIFDPI